jgi:hypothetical protein
LAIATFISEERRDSGKQMTQGTLSDGILNHVIEILVSGNILSEISQKSCERLASINTRHLLSSLYPI